MAGYADQPVLEEHSGDYATLAAESQGVTGGWAFPSDADTVRLWLKRSFRDIDKDLTRQLLLPYDVKRTKEGRWACAESGFPIETSGASLVTMSPSGEKLVVFKMQKGKEQSEAEKPYVEVWSRSGLMSTFALDMAHGRVLGENGFGGAAWSHDEQELVYVAEVKSGKKVSAFAAKAFPEPTQPNDVPRVGEKFVYREDWGEKLEVVDASLYILALKNGRYARVPGFPENADVTPGQPLLDPSGRVIYVAWTTKPRRLGLIYCYQRPSKIMSVDVSELIKWLYEPERTHPSDPQHIALTADRLARSPALSRDGARLAYLASEKGYDTHNGPVALRVLSLVDWDGTTRVPVANTVVPEVEDPSSEPNGFPGLWCDGIPRDAWAADDTALYLTSAWGSRSVVLKVDVSTTNGQPVQVVEQASDLLAGKGGSVAFLTATGGLVVISGSSPTNPGMFGLLSCEAHVLTAGPRLASTSLTSNQALPERKQDVQQRLQQLTWKMLKVKPTRDDGPAFEAILILPPRNGDAEAKERLPPLVVVPHGGPHSVTTTSYLHSYAFLATSFGLAVLHVNFRGSTGLGARALKSLPGNVGTQDVQDVYDATMVVLGLDPPVVDANRVGVCGGSHGGFLTAHAIGQHPELYKAAALRNPVTNVAAMVGVTDIPDWCFVEAGLPYDFATGRTLPTPADTQRFYACSPIRHIDRVKAPTLIAVGVKDKRVPSSQGLEFHHALRARGVPTKLLIYPEDVHAIDRPASEADHWLQIGDWLSQYLS